MRKINVGDKIGRLTLLDEIKENGVTYFWCLCECGETRKVSYTNLLSGNTKSCGCLKREINASVHGTHHMTKTRPHRIWNNMNKRCHNKNEPDYELYGGRGIKICNEWLGKNGFQNFYNWAISHGYRDDLTIDRIDVNGDYCPENCRWVTWREQARNKRNNVWITYNGETKIIAEWARELGIHRGIISERKRAGWSDEECINGRGKRKHENS